MYSLLLRPVRCSEDFIDISGCTVTAVGWIIVVGVKVATVENSHIFIATASKPESGTEPEYTAAHDDDAGLRGSHFGNLGMSLRL